MKRKKLYLETDALGEGLGASLLQARDRMQFPRNEASNNTMLWSRIFAGKL